MWPLKSRRSTFARAYSKVRRRDVYASESTFDGLGTKELGSQVFDYGFAGLFVRRPTAESIQQILRRLVLFDSVAGLK